MSINEFQAWKRFFAAAPFDDLHRYHRPAAMVATSAGGGDLDKRLEWLQPDLSAGALSPAEREMRAMGFIKKGG